MSKYFLPFIGLAAVMLAVFAPGVFAGVLLGVAKVASAVIVWAAGHMFGSFF